LGGLWFQASLGKQSKTNKQQKLHETPLQWKKADVVGTCHPSYCGKLNIEGLLSRLA
jgi:ribosomal protein L31